jgi:hypothetical protein
MHTRQGPRTNRARFTAHDVCPRAARRCGAPRHTRACRQSRSARRRRRRCRRGSGRCYRCVRRGRDGRRFISRRTRSDERSGWYTCATRAHVISVPCDRARLGLESCVVPLTRAVERATTIAVASYAVHVKRIAHVVARRTEVSDVVEHCGTCALTINVTLAAANHVVERQLNAGTSHWRRWRRSTTHAHVLGIRSHTARLAVGVCVEKRAHVTTCPVVVAPTARHSIPKFVSVRMRRGRTESRTVSAEQRVWNRAHCTPFRT